jgi:hypothetical protein
MSILRKEKDKLMSKISMAKELVYKTGNFETWVDRVVCQTVNRARESPHMPEGYSKVDD